MEGIREMAVLKTQDLIVVGAHGLSGLNRWMLGSVAERVVRVNPLLG